MIKPFTITNIREEPDGNKTVFFQVKRSEQMPCGNPRTLVMESALYVLANEDVDQVVFNSLENSGWI